VHELTHAIVQRGFGSSGGSWLQEGFAQYVETRYRHLDPVREFAADLRNGSYTKLEEFIRIPILAFAGSKEVGSQAHRLYAQAGAFFAFLHDGPFADRFPTLVDVFVKTGVDSNDMPQVLAKMYDRSLADLEKAWVQWGTAKNK
jgi:hypothetical protein